MGVCTSKSEAKQTGSVKNSRTSAFLNVPVHTDSSRLSFRHGRPLLVRRSYNLQVSVEWFDFGTKSVEKHIWRYYTILKSKGTF